VVAVVLAFFVALSSSSLSLSLSAFSFAYSLLHCTFTPKHMRLSHRNMVAAVNMCTSFANRIPASRISLGTDTCFLFITNNIRIMMKDESNNHSASMNGALTVLIHHKSMSFLIQMFCLLPHHDGCIHYKWCDIRHH
jgi:hypothetical protein